MCVNQVQPKEKSAEFTVDKAILKHLIYQQAGSLSKALLELAMNGIDAGANEVRITFSPDLRSIVVEDDGRGFVTAEEVEHLFGVFGFDHQTEQEQARGRKYGRFGLGRGQIFAFGRTVWTTNQFQLRVDLDGDGGKSSTALPYTVTEYPEIQHRGCKIEISLYKVASSHEVRSTVSDLKEMLQYTSKNVYLNQERVNTPPSDVKWTENNGRLAFKAASITATRGLRVYNDGVYVKTYPHSQFEISGDLTSIDCVFDVNMARNDVQQATCDLWKEARKFIKPHAERRLSKSMTDEDRIGRITKLLSGDVTVADVEKERLFDNYLGKHFTMKQMFSHGAGHQVTCPVYSFDPLAEKIHKNKVAFVLSSHQLSNLPVENAEALVSKLKEIIREEWADRRAKPFTEMMGYELPPLAAAASYVPYEEIAKTLNTSHEVLSVDEVSEVDKIKLLAFSKMNELVAHIANITVKPDDIMNRNVRPRKLVVGRSETALAWTDSRTYIAIRKDLIDKAFSRSLDGVTYIMNLLAHEYSHVEASAGEHSHGLEFYSRYHDITTHDLYRPAQAAKDVWMAYARGRKKAGMVFPKSELERATRDDFSTTLLSLSIGADPDE